VGGVGGSWEWQGGSASTAAWMSSLWGGRCASTACRPTPWRLARLSLLRKPSSGYAPLRAVPTLSASSDQIGVRVDAGGLGGGVGEGGGGSNKPVSAQTRQVCE